MSAASIRTLLVDDEPLAFQLRLAAHADVTVVGGWQRQREAAQALAALRPDLMLLDVQMPEVDGFALLRSLPAEQLPITVFVTAYDQYALAALARAPPTTRPAGRGGLAVALTGSAPSAAIRFAGHRDRLPQPLAHVPGARSCAPDEAFGR